MPRPMNTVWSTYFAFNQYMLPEEICLVIVDGNDPVWFEAESLDRNLFQRDQLKWPFFVCGCWREREVCLRSAGPCGEVERLLCD